MDGEFWAAIAGAVLGGGIAALVQWLSIRHTTRERRRGIAYSLLFKVGQIYSHLRLLNRAIEAPLKDAAADDLANPWRVVQGIANMPSRVTFTTDEMALVLELAPGKLLDDLLMLDEKHNATIDAFQFYSDRRTEFTDALTPVQVDGQHAFAEVPVALRPKALALNNFLAGVRKHLDGDVGRALNVLQQLAGLFEKPLAVTFAALPKADQPGVPDSGQPTVQA